MKDRITLAATVALMALLTFASVASAGVEWTRIAYAW